MKFIKIILLITFSIIFSDAFSQKIDKNEFNVLILNENFDAKIDYFPTNTDYDSYLIVDNGDYLVSRNIEKSQFIKLNIGTIEDYNIETSIRIGPSKNSSSGIVLCATKDNKLIFEINGKKEYRIYKSYNSELKFLTDAKNDGWVKTKKLKRADRINKISICKKGNYFDFYFNGYFIKTKTIEFKNHEFMGLHVNGNSKARYGFFKLMSNKIIEDIKNEKITKADDKLSKSVIETNNSVIKHNLNKSNLKNQKKETEKISLKDSMSSQKILNLTSRIDEMSLASIVASEKITKLTKDLEKKSLETNNLSSKISESKQLVSDLEEERNKLSEKNLKLNYNIKDLNKKIKSLESEKKSLNSQVIDIRNSLASSKKSNDNLNKKLKNLNTQLEKLEDIEKKFKLCEKSIVKLSTQKRDLESKIQVLDMRKTQLENENKMQLTSQNNLLIEKNSLEKIIVKLEESNIDLNNIIFEKQKDYSKLKEAFVYMDFDKNGVDSMKDDEMTTEDIIVESNNEKLNKTIYFTVNLGILLTNKSNKYKDAPNLWIMNNNNNTFSYMSNRFDSLYEATAYMNDLSSKGFKDLSVVKID